MGFSILGFSVWFGNDPEPYGFVFGNLNPYRVMWIFGARAIFMIHTQFVDLVLQQLILIQVSFLFGRVAGWMGVRRGRGVDNQMQFLQ